MSDKAREQFDKWWVSTNNTPFFSNKAITVQKLKEVAFEVWQASQFYAAEAAESRERELQERVRVLTELEKRTFAIQYNPNCPSPYLVRLIGKGEGRLDMLDKRTTKDILGYGQTLTEAANAALPVPAVPTGEVEP